MEKSDWGVHETHCCVLHGCKYSDEDCPVVKGETKQEFTCEDCEFDGIEEIPDPSSPDYDLYKNMGAYGLDDYLLKEALKLRAAIRSHRDEKGQGRCQRDDLALYSVLPESGFVEADLKLPPAEEFIPGCVQYWMNRQLPEPCQKVLALEEIKGNPEATAFLKSLQKLILSVSDAVVILQPGQITEGPGPELKRQ